VKYNDNNFFDEEAKPDILYSVNTNTKNAQQNEIHHVNTDQDLLLLVEYQLAVVHESFIMVGLNNIS
jgi:hypothetical protein